MKLLQSKEVRIGFFSLTAGVILYLGFNYLKGLQVFSSSFRVYAVFKDVQGLVVSSPVLVNGLNVGRVSAITLERPSASSRVVAHLDLDVDAVVLQKGTSLTLVSTDLLGGKALRINAPLAFAEPLTEGDTIPADIEPSMSEAIAKKLDPLVLDLDAVAVEMKVLLKNFQGTTRAVEATLGSVKGTADASTNLININSTSLSTITGNAAKLSGQLLNTQKELDALLRKYGQFGDTLKGLKLAQTVGGLNKGVEGLNSVLKDINAGKGSMGKLLKSDSLYTNLNHSSAALDALLIDMKARPGRYLHFSVFGKKDKK